MLALERVEIAPQRRLAVAAGRGRGENAFEFRQDQIEDLQGLDLERDQIAVIDTARGKVLRYLSDAAPAGPAEGSTPNALALSHDESQLFVAEADNNAVAVFDVSEKGAATSPLKGRIPTDWYPTAVVDAGGQLLVLNGKGRGSHGNPDGPIPGEGIKRPLGYDLGQLNGTLRSSSDQLSRKYVGRVLAAGCRSE